MVKPTWGKLRGSDEPEDLQTDKTIRGAMARIGQTDDGIILQDWLIKNMIMVAPKVGVSDGALRDFAAGKRVAVNWTNLLQGEKHDSGSGPFRRFFNSIRRG